MCAQLTDILCANHPRYLAAFSPLACRCDMDGTGTAHDTVQSHCNSISQSCTAMCQVLQQDCILTTAAGKEREFEYFGPVVMPWVVMPKSHPAGVMITAGTQGAVYMVGLSVCTYAYVKGLACCCSLGCLRLPVSPCPPARRNCPVRCSRA